METHAASAKQAHYMKIAIAIEFLFVIQWRVKLAPGVNSVVNACKQVWTTMETPSVCATDSQRPNSAIVRTHLTSTQTAVQMCQQVPGVINATSAGRLKCYRAGRKDALTLNYGGQKLKCVPQTSPPYQPLLS